LLKKIEPNKIKWDERTIESFKSLKDIHVLLKAPVLITSDFSPSFIVQTNASQHVIYAVLSQESSDGDHPMAYHNQKLLHVPREQNYSTIEKELLAIVWAIRSFFIIWMGGYSL
jgi:hypothetical protein